MKSVSGTLIPRNYSQFRGVDFSNRKDEVNIYRSPDALNMWKNYKNSNGKCIETRPDVELLGEYNDPIYGLFFYDYGGTTHRIVHTGTKLYDGDDVIYSSMAAHKSNFFIFDDVLYVMDGTNYIYFNGTNCGAVVGYVPTTSISRSPSGGGRDYQKVNLLSSYAKNQFCADGTSTIYKVDSENNDDYVKVWVNGSVVSNYTYNKTQGKVTFTSAPPAPDTDGRDNVVIEYSKTNSSYANEIKKCTLLETFDDRVFVSGNPDHKGFVWFCELNNPTYFGDTDYLSEGLDNTAVKALVSGNNALWVIKEPSHSNTTIFYINPSTDADGMRFYPSSHSSISTGCKTTGINFNDTICFYSENGLEAITSDVTTEQVISHKSSLVDSKLLNETKFNSMLLEEWEGYLLTIIGNKVYLADSRQYSEVNGHYEYEWYYLEFKQEVTATRVKNGILYLCTKETISGNDTYRVYTLTDMEDTRNVESYWTTIEDEFNYPQYQKTTNKKGCVVDTEGKEITIYAKIDRKPFDLIKKYTNVKGYVVPRIKKKKWKSIQLKFYSKKPFQLYSSTLESYIGSYIKR